MLRRPSNKLAVAASLVAAAWLSTACSSTSSTDQVAHLSGSGGGSVTSTTLSQNQLDQGMVDYARCLRSHGVDEPDPAPRPGHSGLSVQIPVPGPATNAALAACNHFLQPLMQMKQAHARQELAAWLPQLTAYAQCMRAHDISILDPNSMGALNLGSVPGITGDFGRYSPQFRSADSACRHLLPAAVRDPGSGP